ncbi:MAG: class IV adenylate cyclase [Bacteroidetes bacterium]|nr:class IV adenylate cyclase [Bacteroidota bacterium]
MLQNLELKARIPSLPAAIRTAAGLHSRSREFLCQRDIYYNVRHGRLKLRIINSRTAELIYYIRPNKGTSRYSDYIVMSVGDPQSVNKILTTAIGRKIIIDKKRRIFLYKNARIHIDDVYGLGSFIEFEVQVKNGRSQAKTLLKNLVEKFKIKPSDTEAVSYSDLLMQKQKGRNRKRF